MLNRLSRQLNEFNCMPSARGADDTLKMTRRSLLGVMAAGFSGALSGCGLFVDYRYRCKLTVEVETPRGLKRGSSVFEVKTLPGTDLMTGVTTAE